MLAKIALDEQPHVELGPRIPKRRLVGDTSLKDSQDRMLHRASYNLGRRIATRVSDLARQTTLDERTGHTIGRRRQNLEAQDAAGAPLRPRSPHGTASPRSSQYWDS